MSTPRHRRLAVAAGLAALLVLTSCTFVVSDMEVGIDKAALRLVELCRRAKRPLDAAAAARAGLTGVRNLTLAEALLRSAADSGDPAQFERACRDVRQLLGEDARRLEGLMAELEARLRPPEE